MIKWDSGAILTIRGQGLAPVGPPPEPSPIKPLEDRVEADLYHVVRYLGGYNDYDSMIRGNILIGSSGIVVALAPTAGGFFDAPAGVSFTVAQIYNHPSNGYTYRFSRYSQTITDGLPILVRSPVHTYPVSAGWDNFDGLANIVSVSPSTQGQLGFFFYMEDLDTYGVNGFSARVSDTLLSAGRSPKIAMQAIAVSVHKVRNSSLTEVPNVYFASIVVSAYSPYSAGEAVVMVEVDHPNLKYPIQYMCRVRYDL